MRKLRHIIEYSLLKTAVLICSILPLGTVRFLARVFADFIFYCIPVRKAVTLNNLKESFKTQKTETAYKLIAKKAYEQFAMTFFELLSFPAIKESQIIDSVIVENAHLLEKHKKTGKGAIIVGSHFGNWEIMGARITHVWPITFLVGQQTNIYVDNYLNSIRQAKSISTIPLKFALRGVMKTIKNNGLVAILADQDAHENGAFVNFFGRPASTPKAPVQFALRMDCPILLAHCIRKGSGFRCIIDEVPKPELTGNEETDIFNYTQVYVSMMEKYISLYPDHWFWMHRRWKTKKPNEKS